MAQWELRGVLLMKAYEGTIKRLKGLINCQATWIFCVVGTNSETKYMAIQECFMEKKDAISFMENLEMHDGVTWSVEKTCLQARP